MSKNCAECGAELSPGATRCRVCFTKVANTPVVAIPTTPTVAPTSITPVASAPTNQEISSPVAGASAPVENKGVPESEPLPPSELVREELPEQTTPPSAVLVTPTQDNEFVADVKATSLRKSSSSPRPRKAETVASPENAPVAIEAATEVNPDVKVNENTAPVATASDTPTITSQETAAVVPPRRPRKAAVASAVVTVSAGEPVVSVQSSEGISSAPSLNQEAKPPTPAELPLDQKTTLASSVEPVEVEPAKPVAIALDSETKDTTDNTVSASNNRTPKNYLPLLWGGAALAFCALLIGAAFFLYNGQQRMEAHAVAQQKTIAQMNEEVKTLRNTVESTSTKVESTENGVNQIKDTLTQATPAASPASSPTPQSSPTPTSPAIIVAPVSPSAPPSNGKDDSLMWAGERFPATRQRLLTATELTGMNCEQIRYAINELYARHGYPFYGNSAAAKRKRFEPFGWYHPQTGKTDTAIDAEMSSIEKANVKSLAQYRANKSCQQ